MEPEQQLVDRAREWVNENHPDLVGEAYEECLARTMDDLAAIDSYNDNAEML